MYWGKSSWVVVHYFGLRLATAHEVGNEQEVNKYSKRPVVHLQPFLQIQRTTRGSGILNRRGRLCGIDRRSRAGWGPLVRGSHCEQRSYKGQGPVMANVIPGY